MRKGAFEMGLNMAAPLRTLKVHMSAHTSGQVPLLRKGVTTLRPSSGGLRFFRS